jgi:hypothetical protein
MTNQKMTPTKHQNKLTKFITSFVFGISFFALLNYLSINSSLLPNHQLNEWLPTQVQAQEASSSTKPSPEEVTKANLERIRRIVEEKGDQIKGVIDQISQQKRGFIGQIQRITEESITLTNRRGTQVVTLSGEVTMLKAGKEIKIEDVAVGDWVLVLGLIKDEIFTPKRILVSTASLRPKDHFVELGTITALNRSEISILSRQNEAITINLNKKTAFEDRQGEKASSQDFIEDIQVLIVGYQDDEGKTATTVRALISLESLQDN